MNPNWKNIVRQLNVYPAEAHLFLPPCPDERIELIQSDLGRMPNVLAEMLKQFNGAKLFKKTVPLVSIFGISTIPPLPALQWAEDWYVDKFTRYWRANGNDRKKEWAIAMMNYGGLVILEDNGTIKEWDTAQQSWGPQTWQFNEWLEYIVRNGDDYLSEE